MTTDQAKQRRLTDSFGRVHNNLRVSVTDRCNIRCFYCMPADNVEFMPRDSLLSFEEIEGLLTYYQNMLLYLHWQKMGLFQLL